MPTAQLVIRCSGRPVNQYNNEPTGRECGRRFESGGQHQGDPAAWTERARAGGWRVSPLDRDDTVNAMCPTCSGGTTR